MDPVTRLAAGRREFGEYGGVNASIEVSTTFTVLNASTLPAIFAGEAGPDKGCYVYGRAFNPTVRHLGHLLAKLEDTEAAYPTASGMGAVSSALMALCNSGDHIIASNTIYGGTFAFLQTFLPRKCNVHTTFVDISNLAAVEAAITDKTKVIYTEVLSNPTLTVADLSALSALARRQPHPPKLVVDNTFTPCIVTPAHWGADIVIHSMTKFISGASDIIAGAICGPAAFINGLMDFHAGPCMLLGPTMDPRIASELSLRLPHLALRVQEHSRRAMVLATRLAQTGAKVTYPGLPGHPQHALMSRMLNEGYGYGGLLGIDMDSAARAEVFMERLQNKHGFGFMAVSLGYFDTLMSLSSASTSSELSDEDKAASGISDGYVRMSVGITGTLEQRWQQLEESYLFAAQYKGTIPPYRAVRVRREPDGQVTHIGSWPSQGSFQGDLESGDDSLTDVLDDVSSPIGQHAAVAPALTTATAPAMSSFLEASEGDMRVVVAAVAAGAAPKLHSRDSTALAGGSSTGLKGAGAATAERPLKVRRIGNEEITYHPVAVAVAVSTVAAKGAAAAAVMNDGA